MSDTSEDEPEVPGCVSVPCGCIVGFVGFFLIMGLLGTVIAWLT